MSALDDAKAEVDRLETQAALEHALEQASDAHVSKPSEKTLAAHNEAAEALAAHRAAYRSGGGPRVGGDAVVADNGEGE